MTFEHDIFRLVLNRRTFLVSQRQDAYVHTYFQIAVDNPLSMEISDRLQNLQEDLLRLVLR